MRVALPWLGYACGVCRYCNSGRETLCPQQLNMGYAHQRRLRRVRARLRRATSSACPDGVDPADAAPLTCAGVTTYKAVKVSGARSSSLVAVFGAGGLGHLAVQYARITGASVVAVDINPARLAERARASAPSTSINPLEEDPVAAIQRARRRRRRDRHRGRARSRSSRPIRSLARGGKLVCVGLPAENHIEHPDLRDRARRARHPRLDRRHPPRPRGGLRAAPPRADDASSTRSAASTTSTTRSSRSSTAAPGAAARVPHEPAATTSADGEVLSTIGTP